MIDVVVTEVESPVLIVLIRYIVDPVNDVEWSKKGDECISLDMEDST